MVTKAVIWIEPGSDIAPDDTIECLFNPEEFSLAKSTDWSAEDTKYVNAPKMTFNKGGASSLDLELIFDTTDVGTTVAGYTKQLLRLLERNPNLPSEQSAVKRPPTVRFHWGEFTSFESYVKSVSVTYTYFSAAGTPLRAKAKVSLEQSEDDNTWLAQNPTSGTPHPHRVHVLQTGETLDALAALYYDNPTRWRIIAAANGVTDPLRVRPGTALTVPLSGEALNV
jgi:hypothetical protein